MHFKMGYFSEYQAAQPAARQAKPGRTTNAGLPQPKSAKSYPVDAEDLRRRLYLVMAERELQKEKGVLEGDTTSESSTETDETSNGPSRQQRGNEAVDTAGAQSTSDKQTNQIKDESKDSETKSLPGRPLCATTTVSADAKDARVLHKLSLQALKFHAKRSSWGRSSHTSSKPVDAQHGQSREHNQQARLGGETSAGQIALRSPTQKPDTLNNGSGKQKPESGTTAPAVVASVESDGRQEASALGSVDEKNADSNALRAGTKESSDGRSELRWNLKGKLGGRGRQPRQPETLAKLMELEGFSAVSRHKSPKLGLFSRIRR